MTRRRCPAPGMATRGRTAAAVDRGARRAASPGRLAAAVLGASLLFGACAGPADIRPGPPPAPAPADLLPDLGVYGAPHQPELLVREEGGHLELLADSSVVPLENGPAGFRVAADVLAPDSTAIVQRGTVLAFHDTAGGHPATVSVGDVVFGRLPLGPGNGGTFRIQALLPIDSLRREARAAAPPDSLTHAARRPDLVEVARLDSTIHLDIRYATSNNFMGEPFYAEPRAFLQRPAAEAVVRAARMLRPYGYGLLIHDAYRPWYVTKMFWDATPDSQKEFVADPAHGSRHNRGCAVDLTLYDLATGRPVAMPSGYDEFTARAHADWPGGTALARWHRALLRKAMEAQGFAVYQGEWWHFDYRDWRLYPVLNVRFDEIPGR
ncbi:MAG: M15 family metallopeptidase [Gemmatimonadota bacterium]